MKKTVLNPEREHWGICPEGSLAADIDIVARSSYFLQVSPVVISLLLQGFFDKNDRLVW